MKAALAGKTEIKQSSHWLDSVRTPKFPALTNDLAVDVVVVGGGVTGITAAYLLKKAGKKVMLLERARCAHAESGHTTAHLTCVTDKRHPMQSSDSKSHT